MRVLPRSFYDRPTLEVASGLLGTVLVHRAPAGTTAGVIVEAEAYIGESDPASHAAPGPTPRNEPMYGKPGRAYVYFNYGVHFMMNVVTGAAGHPAAVLIRSLDPVDGLPLMRVRRGARRDGSPVADRDLCRGPGNLTRAMGITLDLNRADLTRRTRAVRIPDSARTGRDPTHLAEDAAATGEIWLEDRQVAVDEIVWTPRIGIQVGTDRPWRCYLAGNPCVSATRRRSMR
jgi:DNA-3-methyladenine glycosylase